MGGKWAFTPPPSYQEERAAFELQVITFCKETGGGSGKWVNEMFERDVAKQDEKSKPKAFNHGSVAAGEFSFRNRHFLPAAKYVICPVTLP